LSKRGVNLDRTTFDKIMYVVDNSDMPTICFITLYMNRHNQWHLPLMGNSSLFQTEQITISSWNIGLYFNLILLNTHKGDEPPEIEQISPCIPECTNIPPQIILHILQYKTYFSVILHQVPKKFLHMTSPNLIICLHVIVNILCHTH